MRKQNLLLSSITLLLVSFGSASACECFSLPSVTQSFGEATAVFSGRVVSKGEYGVWFKVERAWKGVSSDRVYVYTGNARNLCAPWFKQRGQRWLVYAYLAPLYRGMTVKKSYTYKLMARMCDRTALLEDAADDLKQLGEGTAPANRPYRTRVGKH
jgi:hypothetical protein